MKDYSYFVVLTLIICLIGCAPQSATKEVTAPPPTFAWTPPTTATPTSAGVTFAIVGASYSESQPWAGLWPFTDFSKNMALDFQQLVAARGFTVKGPFVSYDELAYSDKKGSDLVLQPTLDVRVSLNNVKNERHIRLIGDDYYTMEGDATVSGRVTLYMKESLSKEQMWVKSIELPPNSVHWQGSKQFATPQPGADFSDASVTQPLGKIMETYYHNVMETAWKYLDPEEMKGIKKQADEIKAKKVY
jgi:hypothetical protein